MIDLRKILLGNRGSSWEEIREQYIVDGGIDLGDGKGREAGA